MSRLKRMVGTLEWLCVAALSLVALACGEDEPPARGVFVEPIYLEPCATEDCGEHGMCIEQGGAPLCLCDVGFAGTSCEVCEGTFHRDSDGRCVTDVMCAAQPSNPCGGHGTCIDESGVIECSCDLGYAGPRCNLCAGQYRLDDTGRCLPVVLAEGADGQPAPVSEPQLLPDSGPGAAANDGDASAGGYVQPSPTWEPEPCSDGYAGDDCGDCALSFHRDEGLCVADEHCETAGCPAASECVVELGVAICTCFTGYAGEQCDECAPGYHPDGASCGIDLRCEEGSCPERATCDDASGEPVCTCSPGYGGSDCGACLSTTTTLVSFDDELGFPTHPNVCGTRDELSIATITARSRMGAGKVELCAPNTILGLESQHIRLELTNREPAGILFAKPVSRLELNYGSHFEALHALMRADGEVVTELSVAERSRSVVSLTFDPPVRQISFWSTSSRSQRLVIDSLVFAMNDCL